MKDGKRTAASSSTSRRWTGSRTTRARKRSSQMRSLICAGACTAFLAAFGAEARAAQTLRVQVDQHGDFKMIGNTLGQDCGPGVPAPVVGTVGACGGNTG